jgi:hypothetical protein
MTPSMRKPRGGRKLFGTSSGHLSQAHSPATTDQFPERSIIRNVRTAINVALVIVSASGAVGQRRGAFIAGPPYAGRPPVAAVAGTPGAAMWNPGSPTTPPCCFSPNTNGSWHKHSRDGNRGPEVLAVPFPVPVVTGSEGDPQPIPPGDEQMSQPLPDPRGPPITVVLQTATPALTGGSTASPVAEAPPRRRVEPVKREPPHVLIALNDGWVYAAVAYWVDKDTLHYVTTNGDHNQVSLSLVDRKISARLNRTSQMAFVLP